MNDNQEHQADNWVPCKVAFFECNILLDLVEVLVAVHQKEYMAIKKFKKNKHLYIIHLNN